MDPGFELSFSWDIPLTDGYPHTFLTNLSLVPSLSHFWGLVNPGIITPILRGAFDAIWIHGWSLATNLIALTAASITRLPVLLRCETNSLSEPTGLKGALKRLILRNLFSNVAGFLAIGTSNVQFYKSYGIGDERIFLTPYAVDNLFFSNRTQTLPDKKRLLLEKHGIRPDLPVILFCGKFYDRKRPFDLLKAFTLMKDRPTASLVFVGDGPLRSEMERFVADKQLRNVYFLGFRNQQEMPTCYALADLLVLPSSQEPWGLVLNEGMCNGLPIIASDRVGAVADLIREGVNGYTYPVGNIEALTDRMQRIVGNEDARLEMGNQSRAIINRWGIEESVQGVLQSLEWIRSCWRK
jgi:glycosyltransferase involved in cell wall biosynthesis